MSALELAVVTGSFPSPSFPSQGTFVRSFALAAASLGHRVSVIHPVSLLDRRKGPLPRNEAETSVGAGSLRVRRPRYLSASARQIAGFNTDLLTQAGFDAAVGRGLGALDRPPALVYGHFLYPSGFAAVRAAARRGVPGVIGVGEGTLWSIEPRGVARARRELRAASGFVAVSTPVAQSLERTLSVPEAKIRVHPNGTDHGLFHPRPRAEARRRLGLPPSRFLVAFAGRFERDKGLSCLLEAARGLPDVGLVLAGAGRLNPEGPQVLFCGPVPHDRMPELLSAADVFVLPSHVEGSCNAVIEAMACGLPIVTSRGAFMDDLVDAECSLRVDPESPDEVRSAIRTLALDPALARRMGSAAAARSRRFDVFERAAAILAWAATLPPAAFGPNDPEEAR